MSDKEILEKAIDRAVEGGWKNEEMYSADDHGLGVRLFNPGLGEYGGHEDVRVLIFSHDFAKALFPLDGLKVTHSKGRMSTPTLGRVSPHTRRPARPRKGSWQYHLQMMAIAENPIKYLGEHM
ncbi:hypothetical protein GCM10022140_22870 [Rhodococcus aetherivorans]|uniref:hypothetical protein n=1 Tax=Rhodococcus aetherivorans TaxID=191292 RepID=UPI001268EB6A|nr:hypothetical protein [Rhodococcus aetherivorans]MDV6295205.1 hypothetical protein [Rhodococcus aetherivorans]